MQRLTTIYNKKKGSKKLKTMVKQNLGFFDRFVFAFATLACHSSSCSSCSSSNSSNSSNIVYSRESNCTSNKTKQNKGMRLNKRLRRNR